ncbi:MAG: hypothetical protein K8L97_07720 [Anaerolineae bacterium]|nr:hypothetical protein [Anaerolineae bacterium]
MRDQLNLPELAQLVQKHQAMMRGAGQNALLIFLGLFTFALIGLFAPRVLSDAQRLREVRILAFVVPAVILAFLLLRLLAGYLAEGRQLRRARTILRETLPDADWRWPGLRLPLKAIWLCLVVGAVMLIVHLQTGDLVGNFAPAAFAALLIYTFVPAIIIGRVTARVTTGPFKKGDYNGALRRVRGLRPLAPFSPFLRAAEGSLLLYAQRPDEAETVSRELLTGSLNDRQAAVAALTNLAQAQLQQGRAARGFPFLEAAARIAPENHSIYTGLAAAYLDENENLERARELAEFALAFMPVPTIKHTFEASQWATLKATHARLLALLGDKQGAHNAINHALDVVDTSFNPAYADVSLDAGYVEQAFGNLTAAQQHFKRAANIDPKGTFGHKAQNALDALPSDKP